MLPLVATVVVLQKLLEEKREAASYSRQNISQKPHVVGLREGNSLYRHICCTLLLPSVINRATQVSSCTDT